MKTIDVTPTWLSIMPALLAVLEDGTDEGKRIAREELMDLARKVDAINRVCAPEIMVRDFKKGASHD